VARWVCEKIAQDAVAQSIYVIINA
jgi:hypothetical protein